MDILKDYFDKNIPHARAWAIQNGIQPDPILNRLKGKPIIKTQKAQEIQKILKQNHDLELSLDEISFPNFNGMTGDRKTK